MMALLLTGLGEKLDGLLKPIKDKVFIKDKERLDQLLKTLILILLILVVMCFIPAGIFAVIEGWSYGDAVYYTLITLTTIGFGDFVIGKNLQESFSFSFLQFTVKTYCPPLSIFHSYGIFFRATIQDIENLFPLFKVCLYNIQCVI